MFSAATKSARGTVAATDPNWASVALLLKGDGANGSTSIVDSSLSNRPISIFGNTQITTSQVKYGTGSITFDGSGDYLTAGNTLELGSSDFTIEMWLRAPATQASTAGIIGRSASGTSRWQLGFTGAGTTLTFYVDGISTATPVASSATNVTGGNWFHVAVTRSSNTYRMFINGVVGSGTTTNSFTIPTSTNSLLIGTDPFSAARAFNGQIDDLRVTVGVARYTANFTPPTAPFPTQAPSGPTVQKLAFSQAITTNTTTVSLPSTVAAGDVVVLVTSATNSGAAPTEVIPSGFTKVGSVTGSIPTYQVRRGVYVRRLTSGGAQSYTITDGDYAQLAIAYIYRATTGTVSAINLVQPQVVWAPGDPAALTLTGTSIAEPSAMVMGYMIYSTDVAPTTLSPSDITLVDGRTIGATTEVKQWMKAYASNETTQNGTLDIPDGGENTPYAFYLELTFAS